MIPPNIILTIMLEVIDNIWDRFCIQLGLMSSAITGVTGVTKSVDWMLVLSVIIAGLTVYKLVLGIRTEKLKAKYYEDKDK